MFVVYIVVGRRALRFSICNTSLEQYLGDAK